MTPSWIAANSAIHTQFWIDRTTRKGNLVQQASWARSAECGGLVSSLHAGEDGGWVIRSHKWRISFMYFLAHSATATKQPNQEWIWFQRSLCPPLLPPTLHATKNAHYDLVQYSLTTHGQGQVHSIFHNETLFENDLPPVWKWIFNLYTHYFVVPYPHK